MFPPDHDHDHDQIMKDKMIQELVKGKESAALLQSLVINGTGDSSTTSLAAQELALKILSSFTHTLSMVKTSIFSPSSAGDDDRSRSRSRNQGDINNNNNSMLSLQKTTSNKKRGCYRRRNATESGIQVSSTMEDGHAWRKYGQKNILNSDYPRCYYRCTHKYDQVCKATKQVQKIQENSHLFQITYFGHHTCNKDTSSSRAAPEIISEIDPIDSCLLSFESKLVKPDTFSSTTIVNPTADVTIAATSTQSDASAHGGYRGNDISSSSAACLWDPAEIGTNYYNEEVVSSFGCMDDVVDFNKLADLDNGLYFDENDFL